MLADWDFITNTWIEPLARWSLLFRTNKEIFMKIRRLNWVAVATAVTLSGCIIGDGGAIPGSGDGPSTVTESKAGKKESEPVKPQTEKKESDSNEESHSTGTGSGSGTSTIRNNTTSYVLTAFNDLGMHCVDKEFSTFSMLPPYNVVNAQLLARGTSGSKPKLLDASQIEIRYSPVADKSGSINSTSIGKTDFWKFVEPLYGAALEPDAGLMGQKMPSAANGPQAFQSFNTDKRWFSAKGIPMTPVDDTGNQNSYPLLRVQAFDKTTGKLLASTDTVVPVSSETDCQTCHATGALAARGDKITWATDSDLEIQTKKNILRLHDSKHGTDLKSQTPVLCASCHYSPALDLAGKGPQGKQIGRKTFSNVMHAFHGTAKAPDGTSAFPPGGTMEHTCYQCHPGKKTQCLRGAMATAQLTCQNCHGGMLAVGGTTVLAAGGSLDGKADNQARRPWQDLPRCQSCHTGDALSHLGNSLILSQAYEDGDASASPRLAVNKRFAENDKTLFRDSLGHGKVACEGCHGSTHAEWPNADALANDNVAANQAQGHAGVISECTTCHEAGSLALTLNGPHGMHNVNDPRWTEHHGDFFEHNPAACQSCHGRKLEGTVLSKVAVDRAFRAEDRNVNVAKGTPVSCTLCHKLPG